MRSLLASVELLFATTAANALVLGSFMRDRGLKKRKFKYGSVADSTDRSSTSRSRRPTVNRHWGSDEDLVRELGLGASPYLREELPDTPGIGATFRAAPVSNVAEDMNLWRFRNRRKSGTAESDDSLLCGDPLTSSRSGSVATPRKVSFFDPGSTGRDGYLPNPETLSPHALPSPSIPAAASGLRRGSTALLQDLGGFSNPPAARPPPPPKPRGGTELRPIPHVSPYESQYPPNGMADMVLMDPGGLLGPEKKK